MTLPFLCSGPGASWVSRALSHWPGRTLWTRWVGAEGRQSSARRPEGEAGRRPGQRLGVHVPPPPSSLVSGRRLPHMRMLRSWSRCCECDLIGDGAFVNVTSEDEVVLQRGPVGHVSSGKRDVWTQRLTRRLHVSAKAEMGGTLRKPRHSHASPCRFPFSGHTRHPETTGPRHTWPERTDCGLPVAGGREGKVPPRAGRASRGARLNGEQRPTLNKSDSTTLGCMQQGKNCCRRRLGSVNTIGTQSRRAVSRPLASRGKGLARLCNRTRERALMGPGGRQLQPVGH